VCWLLKAVWIIFNKVAQRFLNNLRFFVVLYHLVYATSVQIHVRKDCCCFVDLAVGAPYEGHGAVYIFHGSARGIVPTYSQRIGTRDFPSVTGLRAFGASLSGSAADLDSNGYPDLVVGAYASDAVLILRARPVVKIEAEVHTEPFRVNPGQAICDFDETVNVCFQLQICFRFTAQPTDW